MAPGGPLQRVTDAIGNAVLRPPVEHSHRPLDAGIGACHVARSPFSVVGPDRQGPRNQRRTPMAINTAFYPTLMWNSRFASLARKGPFAIRVFSTSTGIRRPPPTSWRNTL